MNYDNPVPKITDRRMLPIVTWHCFQTRKCCFAAVMNGTSTRHQHTCDQLGKEYNGNTDQNDPDINCTLIPFFTSHHLTETNVTENITESGKREQQRDAVL